MASSYNYPNPDSRIDYDDACGCIDEKNGNSNRVIITIDSSLLFIYFFHCVPLMHLFLTDLIIRFANMNISVNFGVFNWCEN